MKLCKPSTESAIYLGTWVLLAAAPIAIEAVQTHAQTDAVFSWHDIWLTWRQFLPYALLFLLHDRLMAPLLVGQEKRWWYGSAVLLVVTLFTVYQCTHRPQFPDRPPHEIAMRQPSQPPFEDMGHDQRPPMDGQPHFEGQPPHDHERGPRPPLLFGRHDFIAILVLILMFGLNIGVKYYFRQRENERRLSELERKSLRQQLDYLRYQINPHFFMNTLNNIHALVDIDPEQAKTSIVELSKMMRFVLYEGDKAQVPLSSEMAFLKHFIALMRLRYTDRVRIDVDLPEQTPDAQVPPLLFATFIENAFKHGVSYQKESFINIRLAVSDGQLHFKCTNSKAPKSAESEGGVGLQNARQRLALIYGERHRLDISETDELFCVHLSIPLR